MLLIQIIQKKIEQINPNTAKIFVVSVAMVERNIWHLELRQHLQRMKHIAAEEFNPARKAAKWNRGSCNQLSHICQKLLSRFRHPVGAAGSFSTRRSRQGVQLCAVEETLYVRKDRELGSVDNFPCCRFLSNAVLKTITGTK